MQDSEFMSAKEKELVLRQWKRFLKAMSTCDFSNIRGEDYGYFPVQLDRPFTDRLYIFLAIHYYFIAHYNRRGFLSARFSSAEAIKETFDLMREFTGPADYRDITDAMLAELKNNLVIGIMARAQ